MYKQNNYHSRLFITLMMALFLANSAFSEETGKKQRLDKTALRYQTEYGLSDKQTMQISDIFKESKKFKSAQKKKGKNVRITYMSFPPDSKEFEEEYKKVAEESARLAAENARAKIIEHAETHRKVYKVLDKEQKKKFLEDHKNMSKKGKKGKKNKKGKQE